MKEIYQELIDRILATVPLIEMIDLDTGQLDDVDEEGGVPIHRPTILLDFEQAGFTALSAGQYQGTQPLRATLCYPTNKATTRYKKQGANQPVTGLDIIDIADQVKKQLNTKYKAIKNITYTGHEGNPKVMHKLYTYTMNFDLLVIC
jgi:hypothetical protein